MSETKFTKGEWAIGDTVTGAVWCTPPQTGVVKPKELLVASVYPHTERPSNLNERIANMKLIAAAPDLLEVLNESLSMMEQTLTYRENNNLTMGNIFLTSTIEKAKAAIKKATE